MYKIVRTLSVLVLVGLTVVVSGCDSMLASGSQPAAPVSPTNITNVIPSADSGGVLGVLFVLALIGFMLFVLISALLGIWTFTERRRYTDEHRGRIRAESEIERLTGRPINQHQFGGPVRVALDRVSG